MLSTEDALTDCVPQQVSAVWGLPESVEEERLAHRAVMGRLATQVAQASSAPA
jgi:hypothetical protein